MILRVSIGITPTLPFLLANHALAVSRQVDIASARPLHPSREGGKERGEGCSPSPLSDGEVAWLSVSPSFPDSTVRPSYPIFAVVWEVFHSLWAGTEVGLVGWLVGW